ncbi:cytochrome P450 [Calocera cornea HHB12733]|uniref:Cytochrome P450 n=1 Tax=Calocera cornea HHB12733 TaxID=1353952 RepID=A0A165DLD9_9BASI|nr:cytochrome P450 [Calocera cornea HHB12733]
MMAPFPELVVSPSPPAIAATAGALILLYFGFSTFYTAFLGPLAQFPGPGLAKFSKIWGFLQAMSLRKTMTVHKMHKQMGPVVRVGPNHLSITAPEIIPRLYSYKPFLKDPGFYTALNAGKAEGHLVSQTDPTQHAKRRKLIATLLTRSAIKGYEGDILHPKIVQAIVPFQEADGSVMDVLPSLRALTVDAAGELTFGKSFGVLDSPGFKHSVIDALAVVSEAVPIVQYLPWLNLLPRWLITSTPIFKPVAKLEELTADAWTIEKALPEPSEAGRTVISRLAFLLKNDEPRYRDNVATSEAMTMIVGGSETTTMALVAALHQLSLVPADQARIREEVLEYIPETVTLDAYLKSGPPSFQNLQQLPFLSAFVKEVLRFYPPVPGLLPRVVGPDGLTVRNMFIPPGTVIAMQSYTVHRDPEVFPDPDTFKASRWLDKSEVEIKAMDARFIAFSIGVRSCVGQDFALAQIFIFLALWCRFYEITPAPGADNGIEDNGVTVHCKHDKLLFNIRAAPIA